MSGECDKCTEHTLDCKCGKQTYLYYKDTCNMLEQFMIDCINELCPNDAKNISLKDARNFMTDWVDENFKIKK